MGNIIHLQTQALLNWIYNRNLGRGKNIKNNTTDNLAPLSLCFNGFSFLQECFFSYRLRFLRQRYFKRLHCCGSPVTTGQPVMMKTAERHRAPCSLFSPGAGALCVSYETQTFSALWGHFNGCKKNSHSSPPSCHLQIDLEMKIGMEIQGTVKETGCVCVCACVRESVCVCVQACVQLCA